MAVLPWYLQQQGMLEDFPGEPVPGGPTNPQAPTVPNPAGPAPPTTGAPTTPPVEDPSGGGGGVGGFTPSGYPGGMPSRGVPKFTAPVFERPDAEAILNSPGYQFRVGQGQQGIERSAAARGLLRTGGTLKDIAEYNQNFASNEYGNEYNRALAVFGTKYQGSKDEYAPLLAEWQTLAQADLARALAAYNRDSVWYNPNAGGGGGSAPIILPPPSAPGA